MEAKKTKTAASSAAPSSAVTTYDWSSTGVTGFDNVQREDLGIPFLCIIQKGNPQVDKDHPDYAKKKIDGAEVGDIFNNLSNEVLWDESMSPLRFIPCCFEKLYMEWKPRESGGGMVKAHKSADIINECQRNEKEQDVLRNGNIVVTTAYFYGIALTDEGKIPCVIGMSSTQLKKSRFWLNLMMSIKVDSPKGRITPPMFSHEYLLTTISEKNAKGSWRGWSIAKGNMVSDPVLIAESMDFAKKSANAQRATIAPPPESDQHIS